MTNNDAVSTSFTIDDIHNIRYENYEKIKAMTHKEILEHTRKEAEYGLALLRELKGKSNVQNPV